MADFNNAIMTDAGAALLAKSTAGIAKTKFIKLVTGAGVYEESEKTRESLQSRVNLKDPKQEIPFSSISMETETCVRLVALISNESLTSGYYVNETGIYAVNEMDEDAEPVLYSIAVANIADYLPPYNGLVTSTITQEYFATVDNALEVTIQTNAGAVALVEDLEALKQEVDRKQDAEQGKGLSTEDYTTTEKQKLFGVEAGANKTIVDSALSEASENPVQNKVVKSAIDALGAPVIISDTAPSNTNALWVKPGGST